MDDLTRNVIERWNIFSEDVKELLASPKVILGIAEPPSESGIYIIYDEKKQLSYVGKAAGSRGLRDRLLNKHVSGDDSHAIQRAYCEKYPNREERRSYIKKQLSAQWLAVQETNKLADLERLLIWLLQPRWNRQ